MPLHKFRRRKANTKTIDLIPVMTGHKPWWKSTTIQSIVANGLTLGLAALKLNATGEESAAIVAAVVAIIATLAGIRGRKNATESIK